MKNTRNIRLLGRRAGLITALALSGFFLAGTTRGNAQIGVVEMLQDGDFESQTGSYLSAPWTYEGKPYGTRASSYRIETGGGHKLQRR
jgi:hypothetical protein